MSDNTIENMQYELAQLRAQRSLIDASINEIELALKVVARYASNAGKPAIPAQISLRKTLSKREQILEGVLAILADGKARHTDVLLKELSASGVEIGGDIPEANLSSYLSRAKDELGLNADRRNGWSLQKTNPTNAST